MRGLDLGVRLLGLVHLRVSSVGGRQVLERRADVYLLGRIVALVQIRVGLVHRPAELPEELVRPTLVALRRQGAEAQQVVASVGVPGS